MWAVVVSGTGKTGFWTGKTGFWTIRHPCTLPRKFRNSSSEAKIHFMFLGNDTKRPERVFWIYFAWHHSNGVKFAWDVYEGNKMVPRYIMRTVVTTHVWYMYRRNFLTEFNMCIFSVSAIIEKANRTDYNDDTTAGTSYRALIFKFKVIFILQYMFSTNSHLFYFIIQVACLLSCAFLCMFPRRKGQRNKNDEYNHFPTINFNR